MFMAGFLTLLLTVKKEREAYDYILLSYLLISTFNLLFFYNDFNYPTNYLELELAGALLPFLVAPFLYFYVCALVLPRRFELKRYLYHFIPFIFMYGSMLYFGAEVNVRTEDGFIQMDPGAPWQMRWYGMLLAGSSFLYPALSLYLLFRHKNRIKNEFSYLEKINLNWLRYWIILSMIGFWFSFIIIWAGSFQWVEFLTSFKATAFAQVVNIAVIGFYGVKQSVIFTNPQNGNLTKPDRAKMERYSSSKLDPDEASTLLNRLKTHMTEEKPYLDSQLSLETLAYQTGMTKHDLSQLINDQLSTNFFGFVNEYRVKAFKERLPEPQFEHYTLLGIALETGFNSKSSFNSIFKKVEGMTPSQYKKSLQDLPVSSSISKA